jgi:hypothetical protein
VAHDARISALSALDAEDGQLLSGRAIDGRGAGLDRGGLPRREAKWPHITANRLREARAGPGFEPPFSASAGSSRAEFGAV